MKNNFINTDLLSAQDYSYYLAFGELEHNEHDLKEYLGVIFNDIQTELQD